MITPDPACCRACAATVPTPHGSDPSRSALSTRNATAGDRVLAAMHSATSPTWTSSTIPVSASGSISRSRGTSHGEMDEGQTKSPCRVAPIVSAMLRPKLMASTGALRPASETRMCLRGACGVAFEEARSAVRVGACAITI